MPTKEFWVGFAYALGGMLLIPPMLKLMLWWFGVWAPEF